MIVRDQSPAVERLLKAVEVVPDLSDVLIKDALNIQIAVSK